MMSNKKTEHNIADQALRLLEIQCRFPVENLLAGEYHSVFKGRGVEFEEVREYAPGDDVRMMDWKVTARTGRPHIKRFIEERELMIYLAVDISASMDFGKGRSKREVAAEVCALIAGAAVKNNDRVGLILFTDQIEMMIPPGKGMAHLRRILDALLHHPAKGKKTDIKVAVEALAHLAQNRSVTLVISDFLTDDFLTEIETIAFRHDLTAVQIRSEHDYAPPIKELMRVEDSEEGGARWIDFSSVNDSTSDPFEGSYIDRLALTTDSDCVQELIGYFRMRKQRSAGEAGG